MNLADSTRLLFLQNSANPRLSAYTYIYLFYPLIFLIKYTRVYIQQFYSLIVVLPSFNFFELNSRLILKVFYTLNLVLKNASAISL